MATRYALYALYVKVSVRQRMALERDPAIVGYGPTWSVGKLSTVGVSQLRRAVQGNVASYVDEFIRAY